MTADLNILEHLGLNLYSNLAAVLTEIVANAWDADATEVKILVDKNEPCEYIQITDNGIGMTINEMNEKYLKVGYRRREDRTSSTGRTTASGRKVITQNSYESLEHVSSIEYRLKSHSTIGLY